MNDFEKFVLFHMDKACEGEEEECSDYFEQDIKQLRKAMREQNRLKFN